MGLGGQLSHSILSSTDSGPGGVLVEKRREILTVQPPTNSFRLASFYHQGTPL